jgi:hypothetical protein
VSIPILLKLSAIVIDGIKEEEMEEPEVRWILPV